MGTTGVIRSTWSAIASNPALIVRAAVMLAIAALYIGRISGGVEPEVRFFDDFFYYVTAAKNWVDGNGSTFFPGEPTNGYHPLWFLWIAFLYRLTGAGDLFFVLVDLSMLVLLAGFFLLFERFLFRLTKDRLAAATGAGLAAVRLSLVAVTGVEMALTVFAAALLLERLSAKPMREHSVRDAAVIGVCGAFLGLSRLDALLIAPGLAIIAALRWDWKRIAAAALAGGAPLAVYFAINLAAFGSLSTASMAAKSLATYFPPNWFVVTGQVDWQMSVLWAGAVAAAALLLRRIEDADLRRIGWALAAAPVLQVVSLAVLSGWMMFSWYHYFGIMVLGMAAGLAMVQLQRLRLPLLAWAAGYAFAAFWTAVWVAQALHPQSPQKEIASIARQLKAFASKHPGVYAMGDAAGTPGWTIGQPIVHLEGLMMSHGFLDRIREQRPLEETFRDYHVQYYVAVWQDGTKNGCPVFAEPSPLQASERSPKMRMSTCAFPYARFRAGNIYDVRVFRIDPATGRPDEVNSEGG